MISVIIPTYNRADLIGETITSILTQSYHDFEIIVVDDHSTDNTSAVVDYFIQKDHRVKYFKRPSSQIKGGNTCRNYGFKISKGEFIKWLDSDDLLDKSCLEYQLKNIQELGADLDICESKVFINSLDGTPLSFTGEWGNIKSEPTISNYLLYQFKWPTGSGLWRKAYFNTELIWELGLTNSQEWLMHLKQLANRIKISKTFLPICFVRTHAGSMSDKSNKSAKYYFNECKARKLMFDYLYSNKVKPSKKARSKISNQFFWFHLFILYKGGFLYFFKVFNFYPSIFNHYLSKI